MQLRTRVEGGGTERPDYWGIDSEYGRLTDLLVGPIDNYQWTPGNAVAQRSERLGRTFDKQVVLSQYAEIDQRLRKCWRQSPSPAGRGRIALPGVRPG